MNRLERLFWFVCVPVRTLLGGVALVTGLRFPDIALPLLAVYTAVTSSGFLYNAILSLRGQKTEGGLGGSVWWNRIRWLHILTWASSCTLAALAVPWAGALLLVDACFAIVAGVAHFKFNKQL